MCIASGRLIAETDRPHFTPDHRFKTRKEMAVLFADVPEALASTVEIAQRCSYRPLTRKPILPRFTVGATTSAAEAETEEAAELRRQAEEGLVARLAAAGCAQGITEEQYRERLAFELGVIERMKYPGYFLIVADFIKWAKGQGIPVGPGRGSGAGSLVAWSLTITDLDPIRFGLLFERFLNPDRVSMPDFDIDFCQDRRDEVIRYVQERYGRDQVAQIITFGTLQARGVLRDVGRVLQMPYGQVDKLTKLVPQNPAAPVTLAAAINGEPKLQAFRDSDPVVARAFDIAQKLEGLTRHASTHAAGIVIGDRPLARARAALPRSEIGHAGHPVQHEVGRACWPREVRLPRPEDADRARRRRKAACASAASRSTSRGCRWRTRQATRCWRAAKWSACSRLKVRACAARWSRCGPTGSRTSSRWWRSIARVRWPTSRPTARASTATRSRNICIRSSSRS